MSTWRLVERELPDLDTPVWLRLQSGQIIIGQRVLCDDGYLWANSYGSIWHNGERWDSDPETDDDYRPTHWMPLPEPPDKETK